jgi:hypothetical protein
MHASEHDPFEVLHRLTDVVNRFLDNTKLGLSGAGEVAVTFELGWYVRDEFGGEWDVHGEYDRLMDDPKWLDHYRAYDNVAGGIIRPDIIVHEVMTTTKNNLMFLEAKLAGGGTEHDFWKLRGATRPGKYEYLLGVHLVIDLVQKPTIQNCTVFTGGTLNHEMTSWLRTALGGVTN